MKSFFVVASLLFLMNTSLTAQSSAVFIAPEGAIHGYDPVAYFTEGKPVKGDKQFTYNWNNAAWYFSSQRTLDSFKVSPEKYAPQYGGYCAYGMADGHKAPTDPEAWTIDNGKLYFNYNKNVQVLWKKNQAAFIETANKNWPAIKDKK